MLRSPVFGMLDYFRYIFSTCFQRIGLFPILIYFFLKNELSHPPDTLGKLFRFIENHQPDLELDPCLLFSYQML